MVCSVLLSIQRSWLLSCSPFLMGWRCKRSWTPPSIWKLRITCLRRCCVLWLFSGGGELSFVGRRGGFFPHEEGPPLGPVHASAPPPTPVFARSDPFFFHIPSPSTPHT